MKDGPPEAPDTGHAGSGPLTAGAERLPSVVFGLPVERIRDGYYSDAYFVHTKRLLRTPPVGCSCRSFRRRTLFWEESTRPRDPPRMQRRPLARRWLDAGVGAAGGQGALRGRRDIAVGDLAPALETQRDGFLSGQMASGRDTGAVDGVHSGAGEDPRSFTAMLEPRQQDRERARLVRPSPVAARQPQTLADCQASRPHLGRGARRAVVTT